MQLDQPGRSSSLRGKLSAAACLLLAAHAGAASAEPANIKWQFDGAGLAYGEQGRAYVVEPTARITRLFAGGQTLSATLGIDVVTGASPTGALASTEIHTTTTPSGNIRSEQAGAIPTDQFQDIRTSLDLQWTRPYGDRLTTTVGSHFSREKDYRSLGGSGKLSISFMNGLTTLNLGGSYDGDAVTPSGGRRAPFTDGTVITGTGANPKRAVTGLVGLSRVLSRRLMMAVDISHTRENGYLTEPYKVLSVVDAQSGSPVGQLTEHRPDTRGRSDVLVSSVYHGQTDILYLSGRYYWDDWGVNSRTLDFKYRHALERQRYVEPHVRYYFQSRANFFRYSLVDGDPLPEYASADYRLGSLHTITLGGTYGFRIPNSPGEWAVRAEFLQQWGEGHPPEAIGNQRKVDLSPPLSIGSVVVLYSVRF